MKKLNKKGFTLVELIVVIAIIGILAAVLVPSVTSYIAKAQKSSAQQNAANHYQELVLAVVDVCQKDIKDVNETGSIGWAWTDGTYTCLIKDGTVVVCEKSSDKQFTYYKADGKTEETTVKSAAFISYTCKTTGKTENDGKFTVMPSTPTTGTEDICKVSA